MTCSVRWQETRTRLSAYEVFTVDGVEYRRAAGPETADLTVPLKTRGLSPLYLRRKDAPAKNLPKIAPGPAPETIQPPTLALEV